MHERSESPATVHRATYAAVCRSLSPRCLKMFLDFSKPPPERSVHRRPGPFPSEGEEPVAMQEKQTWRKSAICFWCVSWVLARTSCHQWGGRFLFFLKSLWRKASQWLLKVYLSINLEQVDFDDWLPPGGGGDVQVPSLTVSQHPSKSHPFYWSNWFNWQHKTNDRFIILKEKLISNGWDFFY